MGEFIKTGFVGFICYKSLKCFGKNDYSDVIGLVTWIYLGYIVCSNLTNLYNVVSDSTFADILRMIVMRK